MFWNPPIESRAFLLEATIDLATTSVGGNIISKQELVEIKRELEELKSKNSYN